MRANPDPNASEFYDMIYSGYFLPHITSTTIIKS